MSKLKTKTKPKSSFVSGHRFSDAANPQCTAAPLGAAIQPSKLIPMILLFVVLAATALAADSSPNTPPAGAMQEKAAEACSTCHESRIIVQQRLSKAAWTKEMDKMIKWGAEVDPKDRDALIDYFSASSGPDQPAYVAPRSVSDSKPNKKK